MVILCRIGNTEADRNGIEELGFAEISADMENQFVFACGDLRWAEHRVVSAAVVVRGQGFDHLPGRHPAEFDLHSRGRPAVRGVEDVCA